VEKLVDITSGPHLVAASRAGRAWVSAAADLRLAPRMTEVATRGLTVGRPARGHSVGDDLRADAEGSQDIHSGQRRFRRLPGQG